MLQWFSFIFQVVITAAAAAIAFSVFVVAAVDFFFAVYSFLFFFFFSWETAHASLLKSSCWFRCFFFRFLPVYKSVLYHGRTCGSV